MNYRRKYQIAVALAVSVAAIGMLAVLYVRSATTASAPAPASTILVRLPSGPDAGAPRPPSMAVRQGGEWEYSPERNPSYMGNTNIQQIGFLTMNAATEPGAAPTILPLFGYSMRYKHSDRWVYFTATDKYQSIRLPVKYESRDCMNDDIGCRELYNGDIVQVPSYNDADFTVSVYKNTF